MKSVSFACVYNTTFITKKNPPQTVTVMERDFYYNLLSLKQNIQNFETNVEEERYACVENSSLKSELNYHIKLLCYVCFCDPLMVFIKFIHIITRNRKPYQSEIKSEKKSLVHRWETNPEPLDIRSPVLRTNFFYSDLISFQYGLRFLLIIVTSSG